MKKPENSPFALLPSPEALANERIEAGVTALLLWPKSQSLTKMPMSAGEKSALILLNLFPTVAELPFVTQTTLRIGVYVPGDAPKWVCPVFEQTFDLRQQLETLRRLTTILPKVEVAYHPQAVADAVNFVELIAPYAALLSPLVFDATSAKVDESFKALRQDR